jgi:hypothetical protein
MFDRAVRAAVVLLVLLNAGLFYAVLTRDRTPSADSTPSRAAPTAVRSSRAPTTTAPSSSASTPTARPTPTTKTMAGSPPTKTTAGSPTTRATAGDTSSSVLSFPTAASSPQAGADAIVLARKAYEAAPFRVVRVSGTVRTPSPAARDQVHLEVRKGAGWSTFPLPAVTGAEGRFTAFVSLGSPGRYRLRVVAAGGGPVSDPFLVTVR